MKTFDWRDTISANLLCLKFFGLWPPDYELYKPDLYLLYSIALTIIIVVLHNVSQITEIFFVYDDLEALSASVFVSLTNLFSVVKRYFFMKRLREIKRLFARLNSPEFLPKNSSHRELVQWSVDEWKKFYVFFQIVVSSNVIVFLLFPVFNGWIKDHKLPFQVWYPFKINGFPNYELTYAYQFICIWYFALCNVNVDALVYAFMMFIGCEFDILADDLKKLNNNLSENLKLCVKQHKDILAFAEDTNNIFNIIIFGQIVASTGGLALAMFQLSLVGVSGPAIPILMYIFGLSTEIFLYCWFGNEIQLKSSQISYAVYQSNWIGQSNSSLRTLVILVERCQRPIKMIAMNLFTFSVDTFIAIIRSAWSYFAVLSRVNSK